MILICWTWPSGYEELLSVCVSERPEVSRLNGMQCFDAYRIPLAHNKRKLESMERIAQSHVVTQLVDLRRVPMADRQLIGLPPAISLPFPLVCSYSLLGHTKE